MKNSFPWINVHKSRRVLQPNFVQLILEGWKHNLRVLCHDLGNFLPPVVKNQLTIKRAISEDRQPLKLTSIVFLLWQYPPRNARLKPVYFEKENTNRKLEITKMKF